MLLQLASGTTLPAMSLQTITCSFSPHSHFHSILNQYGIREFTMYLCLYVAQLVIRSVHAVLGTRSPIDISTCHLSGRVHPGRVISFRHDL